RTIEEDCRFPVIKMIGKAASRGYAVGVHENVSGPLKTEVPNSRGFQCARAITRTSISARSDR
ncbi:hypothetical protein, partial [Mesorhizobium sp. M7A.F.Ca.US.014.04.1.1]|uniref:hypothetical protein n=1 Tax=Mesorhizobium sp. M7A.F.Ca.US.014.04.1.1 TaxID=2496744 RepID=UPI0019CFEB0D